jgi:signal transduction histidine kinase
MVGDDAAVSADRDRVLQVLSNLLGNALKFTAGGGTVTVSVHLEEGAIRFAIGDTGPGIASENLDRIFDRFWKDESAGRRGTGLGLFIVRGIVEAHGGGVWVESELGRGSTFFFTLPAATEAPDNRTKTRDSDYEPLPTTYARS